MWGCVNILTGSLPSYKKVAQDYLVYRFFISSHYTGFLCYIIRIITGVRNETENGRHKLEVYATIKRHFQLEMVLHKIFRPRKNSYVRDKSIRISGKTANIMTYLKPICQENRAKRNVISLLVLGHAVIDG